MNKKGQIGGIIFALIIIISVTILIMIFSQSGSMVFQHGTTRDLIQGYDKGIIWYHAYLKNDHNTAYCFDDKRFILILEQSQREQREVLVTYETYLLRGFFCSTTENYENVIIKNVEFVDK
jgi:hypothetical protein